MSLERMSKQKFGRMWKDTFQDSIDKSVKDGNIDIFDAPNLRNTVSDLDVYELMIQKYPEYHEQYDFYDPAENEAMMTTPALIGMGVRDFGIASVKGALTNLEALSHIQVAKDPVKTIGYRNLRDDVDAWAENVAKTDPLVRAYTEWQGERPLAMGDVFTKRSIPAITQGFMSLIPVMASAGLGAGIAKVGGKVGAYAAAWLMSSGSSIEQLTEQLESEGWDYDDALDMGILGGAMTATMVAYLEKMVPMAIMRGKSSRGLQSLLPAKMAKAFKKFGTDKLGIKRSLESTMPGFVKGIGRFVASSTEEGLTEGIQTVWEEAISKTFSGDRSLSIGKFAQALAETPGPEVAMSAWAGFWGGGMGSSMVDGMGTAFNSYQKQKLSKPEALDKWVDKYLSTPFAEDIQIDIANIEAVGERQGQATGAGAMAEVYRSQFLDIFNQSAPTPEIAKQAIRLAREKLGWTASTVETEKVASGKTAYTKANPDGTVVGQQQSQNLEALDLRKYSNESFQQNLADRQSTPQEDILNLIESSGVQVVQQLEEGTINGQDITPQEMERVIYTIGSALSGRGIVDSKGKELNLLNEAGNFDADKVIGATKFLVGNDVRMIRETEESGGQSPIAFNIPTTPAMMNQFVNNPQNFKNMPIDFGTPEIDPRLQSAPVSPQDAQAIAGAQSVAPETILPSPQEQMIAQPLPAPEAMAIDPIINATSPQAIQDWLITEEMKRQADELVKDDDAIDQPELPIVTEPVAEKPQELTQEQQDLFAPERKQTRTGNVLTRDQNYFGQTFKKTSTVKNLELEQAKFKNYEEKLINIVKNLTGNQVDVKFIPRDKDFKPAFNTDSPYDEMSASYTEGAIKLVHGLAGDDSAFHEVGHHWLSRVLTPDEYEEVLTLAWNKARPDAQIAGLPTGDVRDLLISLEENASDTVMSYLQGKQTFTGRLRDLLRKFWFKIREMLGSQFTESETLEQYLMRIGAEAETQSMDNINQILNIQAQGESISLADEVVLGDDKAQARHLSELEDSFASMITEKASWVAAEIFNLPHRPYKPMAGSRTELKIKGGIKAINDKPRAKKINGPSEYAPVILTNLGMENVLRKTNANVNVLKPLQISNKIKISDLEKSVWDTFIAEVVELVKDRSNSLTPKMNPSDLADKYREFVEILYPLYEIASNTRANFEDYGGFGYGFKKTVDGEWLKANKSNYDFKFSEIVITDDQWNNYTGHRYFADEESFMANGGEIAPFGWYIYGVMTNKTTGERETVIYEHQRDIDPGDKRLVNKEIDRSIANWGSPSEIIKAGKDIAAAVLSDRLFHSGYVPYAKGAFKLAHKMKQATWVGDSESLANYYRHEILRPLRAKVETSTFDLEVANTKISLYNAIDGVAHTTSKKTMKEIFEALSDFSFLFRYGEGPVSMDKRYEYPKEAINAQGTDQGAIDTFVDWYRSSLKTYLLEQHGFDTMRDRYIDTIVDVAVKQGAFGVTNIPNYNRVSTSNSIFTAITELVNQFAFPSAGGMHNFGPHDDPDYQRVPPSPDIKGLAREKKIVLNVLRKNLKLEAQAKRQYARLKNPKYAEAFYNYHYGQYKRFLAYIEGKVNPEKATAIANKDKRISDNQYGKGIADVWMEKSIRMSVYKAKAEGNNIVWMPTYESHLSIEGDSAAALLYRVEEEADITLGSRERLGDRKRRLDKTGYKVPSAIGPFYLNLVGIKGLRILGFEKPVWSKHKMLKVDVSNVVFKRIDRFQTRKFFADRDVRKEIEVLKASYSNSVIRNKARNIDHIIIERADGGAARSMLFDSLAQMLGSKKKAYNLWIESKTERFTDWFGNSPVVDRNGEPIPMWETNVEGENYTFSTENTKGQKMPVFVRADSYVSKRNQLNLFDKGQAYIDGAGNITVSSITQFIDVGDAKFLPPQDNILPAEVAVQSNDDERDNPSIVDAKRINFDFREIGEAHSKRNFIRDMGMYMTDEQYAQTAIIAVSAQNFEEFKTSFEKYSVELGIENYEMSEDFGRSFWQKMKNRTHRRSEEHPEGRMTFEMIFLSKEQQVLTGQEFVILPSGTMRQTEGLAPANIKTGRQLPSTFMQSFPEAQGMRYGVISSKEIAQQRSRISPTEVNPDGSPKVDNFYFDHQFNLNPQWVEMIDKKFTGMAMQYQNQPLNFFFAPRAGDASQLIIGEVPADLEGLTRDEFFVLLEDEVNRKKTMTRAHAQKLTASADKRAEWTVALRSGVVANPHAYAQVIAWHRMAQQVAGSHYLMHQINGEPNVQNWFNRLRITFNDGIDVKNTGESSMWFMNTNDVHFQVGGRKIEHRRIVQDLDGNDHDEGYAYDGFLFTGSAKLTKLTKAAGQLDYIVKSFIRDVKMNPDGTPSRDMIGLKMLEGTPHPQMSIHDNQSGKKLASVITDADGETLWQLYDVDGNATETVESVGSLDERKQGYGETYGALQTRIVVPEYARRIKFLGGSAKRTAAHPVKMNELILDDKFLNESIAGREYLKAQNDYATELGQDYSNMLLGFRDNPIDLFNFVKSDLQDGELPTEVQMYVQLIGNAIERAKAQGIPNADKIAGAMFHGNIASQLMPMLNNTFFTEGLYQMRQIQKGYGSKLFLKPAIELQLNDNEFAVSVQNSTVLNLVEQAYLDAGHKKIWAPNDFTGKVNLLNDWLGANAFELIVHRQPIQQPSSVRVYKLKKLVWGKHGQSAFFNMHNIFHVHEADHDGDTVFIERPSTANGMVMMSKLKNLMNDQSYLKRIRTLEFKIFDFHRMATDLASEADRMMATASNAVAIGAQGMIVNAKTSLAVMGYKNLQIQTELDAGTRSAIYARKPSDVVYPTYLKVDPKMDKYIYDRLISEGDSIVYYANGVETVAKYEGLEATAQQLASKNQRLYYKTTAENEFSILLQMAVDNPKYGYLGLIGFGENGDPVSFLVKRMFYRLNAEGQYADLSNAEIKMLKNVYSEFRYSAMRHGKDEFGNRQNMSESYDDSQRLAEAYLDANGTPLASSDVSFLMASRVQAKATKGTAKVLAISMNNKTTPTENLLMSMHQNWKKHFSEANRQGKYNDIIDPIRYNLGSYQYAHIHAMNDIKGRYIKDLTSLLHKGSPAVIADMESGRAMSQEAGTEFYALLDERNKTAPKDQPSDVVQAIRFEFNKEFAAFTDKWFTKMNEELGQAGRINFSLWFLNGVEMLNLKEAQTKVDKITKLLPVPLIDEMVLSHYLQAYSRHILVPVKDMNGLGELANYGLPFRQINEWVRDNVC